MSDLMNVYLKQISKDINFKKGVYEAEAIKEPVAEIEVLDEVIGDFGGSTEKHFHKVAIKHDYLLAREEGQNRNKMYTHHESGNAIVVMGNRNKSGNNTLPANVIHGVPTGTVKTFTGHNALNKHLNKVHNHKVEL